MATKRELANKLYQVLGTATNVFNSELKQQIVDVGAVDTGRMRNTARVKIIFNRNSTVVNLRFIVQHYFKFVDDGTIHIEPRLIRQKFMDRPSVKEHLKRVSSALNEYVNYGK